MCERDAIVQAGDVAYLFLPLAHSFALLIQLARSTSARRSPTSAATRSRSSPSSSEVRPTYLPSVPRIFEKLYTLVTAHGDVEQIKGATQVGLEGARAAGRGPGGAARAAGALRRRRGEAVQERPRGVRRQPAPGDLGRGADRAGDPRVLLRLRRAGARGLRDDRDGDGVDGLDRRLLPLRLGRPRAAGAARSGSPTTARCCSRARTSSRATTRTTTRRSARSSTAGCTPATSAALDEDGFLFITGRKKDIIITAGGKNLTPANLENDLKQSRWISQAVMHGDRRPVPGGADHARPRGDPALRARARPAGGPRRRCRRSRR